MPARTNPKTRTTISAPACKGSHDPVGCQAAGRDGQADPSADGAGAMMILEIHASASFQTLPSLPGDAMACVRSVRLPLSTESAIATRMIAPAIWNAGRIIPKRPRMPEPADMQSGR